MRKIQLILMLLFVCTIVKGQISTHEVRLMQDKVQSIYDANILNESNSNFEVYLDNWKFGVIYAKNIAPKTIAPLRYFVYNKEFHLVNNAKDTVVLNKFAAIDSIVISDKKFIYTSYQLGDRTQNDYFQELSNGKLKLLKHYTCIFVRGNKRFATGYDTVKPDTYKIDSKLYYQVEDQPAALLPIKKSDIVALLNEPSLIDYVKKHKLKLKREKHLKKLFNYYNSL